MLVGVATRQYARSLEPLGPDDDEPRHEQERRQPPLRRADDGAARGLAESRRSTRSTSSRC